MAEGKRVPVPEVDQALEAVVGAINALTERQAGGPRVVLTLGGLVISGTIIPDWQWFDEGERAARAARTQAPSKWTPPASPPAHRPPAVISLPASPISPSTRYSSAPLI